MTIYDNGLIRAMKQADRDGGYEVYGLTRTDAVDARFPTRLWRIWKRYVRLSQMWSRPPGISSGKAISTGKSTTLTKSSGWRRKTGKSVIPIFRGRWSCREYE